MHSILLAVPRHKVRTTAGIVFIVWCESVTLARLADEEPAVHDEVRGEYCW